MSTVAYRAALVRKIEQAIRRIDVWHEDDSPEEIFRAGQYDAYQDILFLVNDLEDL